MNYHSLEKSLKSLSLCDEPAENPNPIIISDTTTSGNTSRKNISSLLNGKDSMKHPEKDGPNHQLSQYTANQLAILPVPASKYMTNNLSAISDLQSSDSKLFNTPELSAELDDSAILSDIITIPRSPHSSSCRSVSHSSYLQPFVDIKLESSAVPFVPPGRHRVWNSIEHARNTICTTRKEKSVISWTWFLQYSGVTTLLFGILSILLMSLLAVSLLVTKDIFSKISYNALELAAESHYCRKQYDMNRCHPSERVPALEQSCLKWYLCMDSKTQSLKLSTRALLIAEYFGQTINAFLLQFAWKSVLFISLWLFTMIWTATMAVKYMISVHDKKKQLEPHGSTLSEEKFYPCSKRLICSK